MTSCRIAAMSVLFASSAWAAEQPSATVSAEEASEAPTSEMQGLIPAPLEVIEWTKVRFRVENANGTSVHAAKFSRAVGDKGIRSAVHRRRIIRLVGGGTVAGLGVLGVGTGIGMVAGGLASNPRGWPSQSVASEIA